MRVVPIYDGISRRMAILGKRFGENCMFVSQYKENGEKQATVLVQLVDRSDDNDFLALRRLLKALEYRVNESTDFELEFSLKRKEARE